MTYFDFQFFHHTAIIVFTFFLVMSISKRGSALYKVLYGISSLVLLVSGLSLLSSENISLAPPYPLWIWGKLAAWLFLAIMIPVLSKRAPRVLGKLGILFLLTLLGAAYLGVYKIQ